MRIAVVDLGTNTFNLLVAEANSAGQFSALYNERVAVRLGEGGINKGFIAEEALQRGVETMSYYAAKIAEWKCEKVLAFATSAVRNASNGKEFAAAVKTATGISINIISGNQEAEFIANGVRQAVKLSEKPSLVIDIGGGSTEFIILNESEILWKQSFEVGASRMLQHFKPSDPISDEEVHRISVYLLETLQPLWEAAQQYEVTELIGASGSFESLAEMVDAKFGSLPDFENLSECEFNMQQCASIHSDILVSSREQRLKLPGLIPMRVDMIVVSAILVETVISKIGLWKMRYSAYALKEGVLRAFLDGAIAS